MKTYLFALLLSMSSLTGHQAIAQTTSNDPHRIAKYFDAQGNELPSAEGAKARAEYDYTDSIRATVIYYENGVLQARAEYENARLGIIDGMGEGWYDNGQLKGKLHYSHGKYDGELTTYYRNGILRRRETWVNGESKGGKCFSRTGKPVAFFAYETMPVPPGGMDTLLRYISSHTDYPKDALKEGIEGRVLVNFYVDTTGTITNTNILQGVNPSLDAEASRVVAALPPW